MLHGDFKDIWDMWLIKSKSEVSTWKRTQLGRSTIKETKKGSRGLTDSCVEKLLLKLQDSFFVKFTARKQKVHMCNGLKNPKSLPMRKVTARLKVLKSYLKRFSKPANTFFSSGETIAMVIGMILNSWC